MTAKEFNDRLSEIEKRIKRAKSVSVYVHVNPDGDAIGSGVALCTALKKLGKDAALFCEDSVPDKYRSLKNKEFLTHPDKKTYDLGISVDIPEIERMGACMKSFLSTKEQIAIDHHKSHKRFADLTLVDATAAAAGELVFALLEDMKLLDDTIAELLYAAIVSDTGCFSFSSTTQRTHEIACKLLGYNFDACNLIYEIYKRAPQNVFNLKNRVLSKCKFFENGQIGIVTFLKSDFAETNTLLSDTEGIVASVIDVESVKIAFAVSESDNNAWKVSIRTKDGVDASQCASVFGGGGHSAAAGCRVFGFYEDVKDKLLKAARDMILL